MYSERAPEVIGNDYMVMGTTERAYWKEGFTKSHLLPGTLTNLHGFKEYLNFKRNGGWHPNEKENEKPVAHPETEDSSFVDNIAEAMKLIEKMEKHLPITVPPSSALVRRLRRQGIDVDPYKPLEIHSALYMENVAGIACDITPREWEYSCHLLIGPVGSD